MSRLRKGLLLGLLLSLIAMSALAGCAMFQTTKPMTAQEKAIHFMHLWNVQYDDTKAMALMPNLTDAQKEMVRKKKEFLAKSKPLIAAYVTIVDMGQTPSAEQEQEITAILNQMVALGG
jgi:hypothetical protein